MKKLILTMTLTFVASASYGNSCEYMFQEPRSTRILSETNDKFYQVTELEMSRSELEAIRRDAEARRNSKPQPLTATHGNRTVRTDGSVVTFETKIGATSKVETVQFDVRNTNGSFEPSYGQYWVMPHNEGRLLVWSFSKKRVLDLKLPDHAVIESVNFDFANFASPKMVVVLRKDSSGSEIFELGEMVVDLLTGKEI